MRRKAELARRSHAHSDSSAALAGLPACCWPGSVDAQDLAIPLNRRPQSADRWADAQAAAARFADPVAEKLVLYLRLRAPGRRHVAEIADFMQRNPDWPAQAMLERRRQEAIAIGPRRRGRPGAMRPRNQPTAWPPPDAPLRRGHRQRRPQRRCQCAARQAWVDAIDIRHGEAAFLRRWAGVAAADDQWARFQRLAWLSDPSAAARQITRLDHAHHAAAEARLPSSATTRRPNRWWQPFPPARATIPA